MAHVTINLDLPDGVTCTSYERFEDGHGLQVSWPLPDRCTCAKCGREDQARIEYRSNVQVVRDLPLWEQPSFFVCESPFHRCYFCNHRQDILPPFKRKDTKYTLRFEEYVLRETTEKHRFRDLLFEWCRGVEELPPPRTGRHPHRVADTLFAMAFKVYSGFSSRRFHSDLSDAHQAGYLSVPIPGMKVCAFFENAAFTPRLQTLIVRSSLPLRSVETTFAPDSTGFSTSRFVRWHDEKYGVERSGRDWVKAHAISGVKTNVVTAVTIEGRDAGDSPQFKPLVQQTAENFTVQEVPADKAYLSHDNLELVDQLGGVAYVPFKSNSQPGEAGTLWEKMFWYYNLHREEFLAHDHQRSNAESTFAMVKAKFRDHVRSRTNVAMVNEVLCKFLCHNICVVHQSHIELGIELAFRREEEKRGDAPSTVLVDTANQQESVDRSAGSAPVPGTPDDLQ